MKYVVILFAVLLVLLPSASAAQSGANIKILKPGDRRNVELGEITVTVEITGAEPQGAYAWQMLIDGVPQGMVRGATTTNIVMPKPTGPHRLKAELYDAQGSAVSAHEILVMAAPVENREFVFNRSWYVPAMGVFVAIIIGIIILGLRLRPRAAA